MDKDIGKMYIFPDILTSRILYFKAPNKSKFSKQQIFMALVKNHENLTT